MKQKLISFILVGVLSFSCCNSAFAAQKVSDSMFYTQDLEMNKIELSESEMMEYSIYDIDFSKGKLTRSISNDEIINDEIINDEATNDEVTDEDVTKETILDMCTKTDTKNIGGNKINIYSSDILPQYLYNCDTIIEIAEMNDSVYITYLTGNNENVVLNYNSEGLYDKGIHKNETGTSIYISENDATMMQPNTYEMSEELQEFIDECIDNGDIEELYNIEQLNVFEDDGCYVIEEKLSLDEATNNRGISSNSTSAPTTDSSLLSSLKNDFSMYTNKRVLSQTQYCSYLKKNISVTIKEDRDSYKKVSADWKSFAVGTTLTAICTFMSLPTRIIVGVLTGAGVGVSAGGTILSAIKLSRSAVYSYNGNRYGYAYDTTVWKDNVLVQVKKSKGEFAGGYDKNGNFTWIISTPPSAFNESISTWSKNVIKYYNSDLVSNKGKTSFQPD